MSGSMGSSSLRTLSPVGARGGRIAAIRVGLAGLLAAIAFSGCTTSAATIPPASATPAPTPTALQPSPIGSGPASTTPAPQPTQLQPPAVPTDLNEWIIPTGDGVVAAQFFWGRPPGEISGYYFWKKGVYTSEETAPPAICGPTWQVLPASATTYEMTSIQAPPEVYICAFNGAGTSPTVRFPITKDLTAG